MRAAWYDKNGPAADVLRLGELPDPEPGPGDVRVRVVVSGLNPTDVKARAGSRPMGFPRVIPHQDGAGVVDRVGPGVPATLLGQRVWMAMVQWERPFGTAADYVCVPWRRAITLPATASFADGPVEGLTVLVTGGAGAVGHYAIQLAKWAGARVLATVSSPEKAAAAMRAGADATVNYRTEHVARRVLALTDGAGVDRVVEVDFGANLGPVLDVVRTNGVIAAYASMGEPEPRLPFYTMMRKNVTVRAVFLYTVPEVARDAATRDIVRLVEAGRLVHQIGARFPLEAIVAAHEAQESGTVQGNIVIEVAPTA